MNKRHSLENSRKYRAVYKKVDRFADKICPTCGEKFAGTRHQKYCSRECKSIGIQKRRREEDKKFKQFCEEHRDDYLFYMREYFLQNHKKFIGNMHDYAQCEMKKLMKKSVVKSDENVQNVRL